MNMREKFILDQKIRFAKELAYIKKIQRKGLYPLSLSLPLGVQFELTSKCNLRCKHCYNMSASENFSKMTISNWLDVVNDLISHGGIFQCILSGGEPLLLGNKIFDIMTPLHNDGTAFVLITNGFFITKDIINKLKKYNFYWVQVSIDHLVPEQHDEFRGKKDSWKKAVEAAILLSNAGFPLRIAHSLTPESVKYLEQFAAFCYQLGASSLICGEIFLSGRVATHKKLLMSESSYEEMYSTIEKIRDIYKGKMTIYTSSSEYVDVKFKQKTLNTSIIIRPDGNVRLDCTMPFVIGNVLEKPFSQIWAEKGNNCWKDHNIIEYIESLHTKHINHYNPDIAI